MGERQTAWRHTALVQATHRCGFRCGSWRGWGCCVHGRVLCSSSSHSPVRHKDLFSWTMALASAAPWVCLCRGDLWWQCCAASTAPFPALPGSFRGCRGTRLSSAAPSRLGRSCQAQEASEHFTRLLTPHSPCPSWTRGCAGAGPDPTQPQPQQALWASLALSGEMHILQSGAAAGSGEGTQSPASFVLVLRE